MSHVPSEIIPICWFGAQKHLTILLSMLKTGVLLNVIVEIIIHFFEVSLINGKFKRTAFIWKLKCKKRLYCHFCSINASLLNKSIKNIYKICKCQTFEWLCILKKKIIQMILFMFVHLTFYSNSIRERNKEKNKYFPYDIWTTFEAKNSEVV